MRIFRKWHSTFFTEGEAKKFDASEFDDRVKIVNQLVTAGNDGELRINSTVWLTHRAFSEIRMFFEISEDS